MAYSEAAAAAMAHSFTQEYFQIPVVTRAYTTACVLTTAAVQLEVITPFQLYFNPDLIIRRYQIWRLITSFLFFGSLGFSFMFNIIFLYLLSQNEYLSVSMKTLQQSLTKRKLSVLSDAGGRLLPGKDGGFCFHLFGLFANIFFLGQAFIIMLVYVWSRRHPLVRMNFFGLLNFQAPFLPWVLMGFTLLLGNSIVVDLLGGPCLTGRRIQTTAASKKSSRVEICSRMTSQTTNTIP
ncbi:hypothetical protein FQN60_017891 [Etheostoma spectabile]|uniref:Derlin n=1 Tax=Etheostoma spectabile TaxID=54343 RepID=A0A5J5DGF3_9PERO|nr:hypothetical protein FQN60_017891 [Etheostoma spectabile]